MEYDIYQKFEMEKEEKNNELFPNKEPLFEENELLDFIKNEEHLKNEKKESNCSQNITNTLKDYHSQLNNISSPNKQKLLNYKSKKNFMSVQSKITKTKKGKNRMIQNLEFNEIMKPSNAESLLIKEKQIMNETVYFINKDYIINLIFKTELPICIKLIEFSTKEDIPLETPLENNYLLDLKKLFERKKFDYRRYFKLVFQFQNYETTSVLYTPRSKARFNEKNSYLDKPCYINTFILAQKNMNQ